MTGDGAPGPRAGTGSAASAASAGSAAAAGSAASALAAPAAPLEISPGRRRAARLVALGADLLQIFLFPLFVEGFASPVDDALDLAVGAAMIKLVGFHWAFLPSFGAKLVPGVDLVPTWTAAVLLATGSRSKRWLWITIALLAALAAVVFWQLHGRK